MDLIKWLDEISPKAIEMSDKIWEFAETKWEEFKSAELIKNTLREYGFRIRENVAGIPTAFIGEYGSGNPIIAILGEYDALPGLSQTVSR